MKTIEISVDLARELGINEAIVIGKLYQLELELGTPSQVIDGSNYLKASYEDLKLNYFPFWSLSTIRRTFRNLIKAKIVYKKYLGETFDRTSWYSLNYSSAFIRNYYGGAE